MSRDKKYAAWFFVGTEDATGSGPKLLWVDLFGCLAINVNPAPQRDSRSTGALFEIRRIEVAL
jgi:hypothetical protein